MPHAPCSCSKLSLLSSIPSLYPSPLLDQTVNLKSKKKKTKQTKKHKRRNRTFGARRSPRCGWRMELTGLFPPPWRTLGSGHLVPALGRRVWIYLLFFCCFFFSLLETKEAFFFLSLFHFFLLFILFFEWSWLLCRNSLLLPASV